MRFPRLSRVHVVSLVLLGIILMVLFLAFSNNRLFKPQIAETIRVSLPTVEATGLVRIAKQNGLFEKEGLRVVVSDQELGQQSLTDLFSGKADLAAVAETPLVDAVLAKKDFRIIATMHTAQRNVKLIARADHGIKTIEDLQEKKIGTRVGTVGEYVLHLLLLQHGLDVSDVQLVDGSPNELKRLFEDGNIDAYALREPYIYREKQLLGEKAIVFDPGQIYTATYNLVGTTDFINTHQDVAKRFLKALRKAERFAVADKDAAIDLLSKDLRLEKGYLESSWQDSSYRVTLNQLLVLVMENEARWRLSTQGIGDKQVPNVLEYIDTRPLHAVAPAAVNILK